MNPQRKAELLLLAATLIWGSTFVVTKGILDSVSPLAYTSTRFLLAAAIVAGLFPRRMASGLSGAMKAGVILGLFLFAGFALQTIGLQTTTASKSAFFTGMLVVFTPVFHAAAGRLMPGLFTIEKPLLAGNLVGVVLATLGLYLLTSPGGGGFATGDAMTLGSAALFAAYIVYLDALPKGIDAMALTFVIFASCGLAAGTGALTWEEVRIDSGPPFWLALAYLTIFATVIALGVQNRYQAETTPTRAAVIFSLEPVIAAVFAWLVRDERLGAAGMAGAAVIFSGLILSELSEGIPGLRRHVGRGARGRSGAG